jgi:diadenosine tetraphosphate (Ap4A) HIT family hydrolase
MSARKKESEKAYLEYKKKLPAGFCPMCERELLVKEYKHWIITKNRFPYDAITNKHDMLSPKRHIGEKEQLTFEEVKELREIEKTIEGYTSIIYNLPQNQSVKGHLHYHLINV